MSDVVVYDVVMSRACEQNWGYEQHVGRADYVHPCLMCTKGCCRRVNGTGTMNSRILDRSCIAAKRNRLTVQTHGRKLTQISTPCATKDSPQSCTHAMGPHSGIDSMRGQSRCSRSLRWWACALVLVVYCVPAQAARPCDESGYCSTGISKHWVGDIRTGVGFREFLQAVTFKQELILSIFQENADDLWIDQALQLHWELEDMGYAHHVFVTDGMRSCTQLNKLQPVNCVWDSSHMPQNVLSGEVNLWHNRWKLIGRGSRLGYNIMSVDTDFMFFRDPYYHFKRWPFSELQMMGVPEGGSVYNCNGGFMYVQNAKPDGPVSWVFKQVAMSTLRRADDGYQYMSQWTGNKQNCLTFDQSIVSDALMSAAVGRLVFPAALISCKRQSIFRTRAGNNITADQARNNAEGLVAQHFRTQVKNVTPDQDWLTRNKIKYFPEFDSRLHSGEITVPNLAWGYPDELGGRFAPETSGPLSEAFIQQLKDDCPDCPWWPERRPIPQSADPLKEMLGPTYDRLQISPHNARAHWQDGVPREMFAQVPNWLMTSLGNVRRGWVLGKKAPLQGPMVMGHVHAWHMQTHRSHKLMLRKVYGRYNWTIGERIANASGHPNAYALQRDVRRVLALSPNMDLTRLRSWEEFSSVVTGLIQVAMLSNRVVLMPLLPCQAAFMHDPNTYMDAQANTTLCVAPTFWRTPYRYPLPVTLAVDPQGELVGGWARRLRQSALRAGLPKYTWPESQPLVVTALEDPVVPPTQHHHRALQSDVPDDFWEKQTYKIIQPGEWDGACTKDFHAIIPPEFFHWIKYNPEGKRAKLTPTPVNTAFTLGSSADRLKLRPAPAPGGDALAVPVGAVVTPSNATGWSLYDVQAVLPVKQVIEYMQQFADEPLVYLEHPVMVVHSTEDATAQEDRKLADMAVSRPSKDGLAWLDDWKRGVPNNYTDPNTVLSTLDHYIKKHRCKTTFVQPEAWDGVHVALDHGHPAVLEAGQIRPVTRAQSTRRQARADRRLARARARSEHA